MKNIINIICGTVLLFLLLPFIILQAIFVKEEEY